MKKSKDTETQADNRETKINEFSNDNVQSLSKVINKLSAELETVRRSVQKRKSENTSLKVLFYTGLAVLLLGFLYSNSKLQRAHMRSLERNIISLEQRMLQDMNHIKMNLELDVKGLHKLLKPNGTDIFKILSRMDYAISQIHSKKERTATLINRVRLNSDEFSRVLKDETNRLKELNKPLIN